MNNKKPIKEKGGEDIGGQVVQDTTTTVPERYNTMCQNIQKCNVLSNSFFFRDQKFYLIWE